MPRAEPQVTADLIRQMVPFAQLLQGEFPLTPERVVGLLPSNAALGTIGGGVYGGAQMALADIVAAVAAVLAGGDATAAPATVLSSANFLRPARGALTASSLVRRRGRSAVIDAEVIDETGSHATVRQVVSVRTI